MKSLTDNNPLLKQEIAKAAEVAGYLWQKGWAERNGGNLTLNITGLADEEMRSLTALVPPKPIGAELPHLRGAFFYCKGTNRRMRDLSRNPMQNGSIIRITPDCAHYEIIADEVVLPTSELPAHLCVHNHLIGEGSSYKASLHTHPTELVALSHHPHFLKKDVLTRLLWSMIPETRAFCPRGLGIVPYMLPGSVELAETTIRTISDGYDVVLWEKHGVFAVGENITEAFDMVDTLVKSAQIYRDSRAMGFMPEGMSEAQMRELAETFGLPR